MLTAAGPLTATGRGATGVQAAAPRTCSSVVASRLELGSRPPVTRYTWHHPDIINHLHTYTCLLTVSPWPVTKLVQPCPALPVPRLGRSPAQPALA